MSGGQRRLKVTFGPITNENVDRLRELNTTCLPIQYQETFYRSITSSSSNSNDTTTTTTTIAPELKQFAYYKDQVVGGLVARVDPTDSQYLYIMTLAVFAGYRGRGVGSQLLERLLEYCLRENKFVRVALHVQSSNEDAIHFYTEKFGFKRGELVENYYRRIDPPHGYVLFKDLSGS